MLLDSRDANLSEVFSEGTIHTGGDLRNMDTLREAFVYNELSHLPQRTLKKFVYSQEAKTMLENEIMSVDTLNQLAKDAYGDRASEFCCCYMAQENGDPLWDSLVQQREQERQTMNELLAKYGEEVKPHAESYRMNWINKSVPKHLLTGE